MIIKKSVEHLKENKMTYLQHLLFASKHGICCLYAGLLLLCHSLIPGLFVKAGSVLVNRLNKSFLDHNEYIQWKKTIKEG